MLLLEGEGMGARQVTIADSHIALRFSSSYFYYHLLSFYFVSGKLLGTMGYTKVTVPVLKKRGQQTPNCGPGLRGSTSHMLGIPEERTINSASDA